MGSMGERLKNARESLGLNKEQVMERLNISNLGRYEADQRKPALETIATIADFYGVSIDWIVSGRGNIHPEQDYVNPRELNEFQKAVSDTALEVLTYDQAALVNAYEKLNDIEKAEIWNSITFKLSLKNDFSDHFHTEKNEAGGPTKTA